MNKDYMLIIALGVLLIIYVLACLILYNDTGYYKGYCLKNHKVTIMGAIITVILLLLCFFKSLNYIYIMMWVVIMQLFDFFYYNYYRKLEITKNTMKQQFVLIDNLSLTLLIIPILLIELGIPNIVLKGLMIVALVYHILSVGYSTIKYNQ